jgi:hypothetical protein
VAPGTLYFVTDEGVLEQSNGAIWETYSGGAGLHAASHENGGGDEISVAGLSGVLADPQTPTAHAASHSAGSSDPITVTNLAGFPNASPAATFLREDGTWASPPGGGGSSSGQLIGVQRITATGAGTYTPTAGTASIVVEGLGGGGGGGGVSSPGSSNIALARAGQGAGWFRKRLTANFSGASYVVGAKGTGGAAGNNAGTDGADTTFTDTAGSPTTYTAGGGKGGTGSASLGTAPNFRDPMTGGGVVINGDDKQDGWIGQFALTIVSGNIIGGRGGNSRYGCGGVQAGITTNGTQAGAAATGKGAGGGAACAMGSGVAAAGGNGSDGVLIIWEYA